MTNISGACVTHAEIARAGFSLINDVIKMCSDTFLLSHYSEINKKRNLSDYNHVGLKYQERVPQNMPTSFDSFLVSRVTSLPSHFITESLQNSVDSAMVQFTSGKSLLHFQLWRRCHNICNIVLAIRR